MDEYSSQTPIDKAVPSTDPSPARALGADLLTRWKSLGGSSSSAPPDPSGVGLEEEKHEDDKTVEELLADLGPADTWEIGKSEEDQVADLLKSAKSALAGAAERENDQSGEGDAAAGDGEDEPKATTRLPAIDISVFQPEPQDEDEEDTGSKAPRPKFTKDALDQEADDILARILDEVKHEPPPTEQEEENTSVGASDDDHKDQSPSLGQPHSEQAPSTSTPTFPTTPSKLPEAAAPDDNSTQDPNVSTDVDDLLASRFASLSLPSVPSGIKPGPKASSSAASKPGFTDEEIDTWCIICSDNATLQCIGCDGDLYCTNCWVEGHRGEDAGMEERRHKAVQFVKGGGKKKTPKRRVMVGA